MSDTSQLKLVVATGNPGKLRELRAVLADLPLQVIGLRDLPPIPEPPENAETFAQNARDKAKYYAQKTGQWCLADDSGLVVDALGGQPGVHSARFAADECPPGSGRQIVDQANNAKLLRLLAGVPDDRRSARFVCHLALYGSQRILLETDDKVEGQIIHAPRGHNGFGYDPLFLIPDLGCTTAELTDEQKNAVSHRGKATRLFSALLHNLLGQQY